MITLEPDIPEPPPVPSAHPAGKNRIREALQISTRFYIDMVAGGLLVALISLVASSVAPMQGTIFVLFAAVVVIGACLVRMVKSVVAARLRGRPPLEATLVFWAALLLPSGGLSYYFYRQYQDQDPMAARRAEAKSALAQALRAEVAYKKEFGKYTVNIKELGFSPEPGARYVLGFPDACTAKYAVEGAKSSWDLLDFTLSKPKKLEIETFFRTVRNPADCPDPKEGFELYAVGVLFEDKPLDEWKIDDTRKLMNVQKGF